MALSHGLAQSGTPADRLDTSATVTFVPGEGITKVALTRTWHGARSRRRDVRAAAEDAKIGCPVSKALAGVPEITLDAALA